MNEKAIGLIIGNRGCFTDHLCDEARSIMLRVFQQEGVKIIIPHCEDTAAGSVQSYNDAKKYAAFFKSHSEEIMGVVITLPNFAEERAIADTLRLSALKVPVLVHAFPDQEQMYTNSTRRDSFWGKISVCNNLKQYGIPFSLTENHVEDPTSESFRSELQNFIATCRIVDGFKNLRVGLIGSRPAVFKTVRFSEKILERNGITVETIGLSDVIGRAEKIERKNPAFQHKKEQILSYLPVSATNEEAVNHMAQLGLVIDQWVEENGLKATAVQCWSAMQQYFHGIMPCTLMSMMSNSLMPSACETDIVGALSMYTLSLASRKPSALVDWNNNYGKNPDKGVVFHCSNFPKDMLVQEGKDKAVMGWKPGFGKSAGQSSSFGTISGRIKAGPFCYCRISTDDLNGSIKTYIGEGVVTEDELETFGGFGVVQVPKFQKLLQYICRNGFEHHAAINLSKSTAALQDAFVNYLGWDTYLHDSP